MSNFEYLSDKLNLKVSVIQTEYDNPWDYFSVSSPLALVSHLTIFKSRTEML